jgi:tetratricopeptide (TPR) repeat protein
VALARTETNGVWRASLTRMLAPYLQEQPVAEWVQSRLRDEDELVRAAAVHVLSSHPAFLPRLAHLRTDPSRLVRLDAAWATRDQFDSFDPAVAGELAAWLRDNADQPSGALQMAQFALSRGDHVDTERWADRLLRYDNSGEPVLLAARLSHAAGDATKAAARLEQALTTRPEFVEAWFMLGMIRGEVGDTAGAMEAFRRVVLLDPAHGRAWYNLGLAQIRTGNANAGLIALAKAERSPRETADAAYAIATVHAGAGEWELARAALARALAADPNHLPALRLRAQLPPAPR